MVDYYREISDRAAIDAGDPVPVLFVYSEIINDVMSLGLFVQPEVGASARCVTPSPELFDLVYSFWETGDSWTKPRSWEAMEFLFRQGKASAYFTHFGPEELAQNQHDRRAPVLARYFPGVEIDYSILRDDS